MAGKCRWCGKGARSKYCYKHLPMGRMLDDIDQQVGIVEKMRDGQIPVSLNAIRDNLLATKQLVLDELGRT